MNSKEKVQAAVMERLQTKTGLDLKVLDITTTSVSFDKNLAFATVAIHPKGDATVAHGMSMKYTLEDRGGRWVVVNAGGSTLGGRTHGETSSLPPGHPNVHPSNPEGPKAPRQ